MYIIHKRRLVKPLEQLTLRVCDGVPSHLWNFILTPLRIEVNHISVEDAQTIRIAFLAMAAEKLHADADTEQRLAQSSYHFVQLVLLQILHGGVSLTLSGKHYTIRLHQHFCIIGHSRSYPQSLQSIDYGIDIAGIIFYYRYVHKTTFILQSYNKLPLSDELFLQKPYFYFHFDYKLIEFRNFTEDFTE
jgi:hypothetical protein